MSLSPSSVMSPKLVSACSALVMARLGTGMPPIFFAWSRFSAVRLCWTTRLRCSPMRGVLVPDRLTDSFKPWSSWVMMPSYPASLMALVRALPVFPSNMSDRVFFHPVDPVPLCSSTNGFLNETVPTSHRPSGACSGRWSTFMYSPAGSSPWPTSIPSGTLKFFDDSVLRP